MYSTVRFGKPIVAFTGFYEKIFSKELITKATYTIDDFSATNFGFGVLTHIAQTVNIYAMVNNLLEFTDIANTNSVSFQFGINLIFK